MTPMSVIPVLLTVLAHGSHDRGVGEEYYYNIAQMPDVC